MKHLPLTADRVLVDHRNRVRALERDGGPVGRPGTEEVAVFSHAGTLTVTAAGEEPEHDVQTGGQVTGAVVRLKTAGTTDTVVAFYLNGALMGSVTLSSGETRETAYLGDYRAKSGDGVAARITTAGTGAKGLGAKVRMRG